MIILDSDVIIDFLRQYAPAVDWFRSLGDEELALPGYVVMELMQGCENKAELRALEKFVADFRVVWPAAETCDAALAIFAQHNLSHNLGVLDALIGQTAVALSLPLHTHNRKHYAAIPDLRIVQPYRKL